MHATVVIQHYLTIQQSMLAHVIAQIGIELISHDFWTSISLPAWIIPQKTLANQPISFRPLKLCLHILCSLFAL